MYVCKKHGRIVDPYFGECEECERVEDAGCLLILAASVPLYAAAVWAIREGIAQLVRWWT